MLKPVALLINQQLQKQFFRKGHFYTNRSLILQRRPTISKSFIRHESHGGVPGENFPMKFGNKWNVTKVFLLMFPLPFWIPYGIVVYHLTKD